ncbi:hypothetical protein [Streptomyces sp. CA-251251]|uniref:hypothetical protein n=1 Tax=Streptomyces sp. CA-251251 TaxID=3240063 RepID=UPI003D92C9F0
MHRTTTTATLLVTMAVSALAGCTTVHGPAPAGPSADGARSSGPRPDGPAEPRVVQAPAREALGTTEPSRAPDRASGAPRRATPPAAPPRRQPPAVGAGQQPRPARPAAPKRTRPPERARTGVPSVPRSPSVDTGGSADVCSLGRKYGGWRPGSPEAAICEQTYGR